MKHKRVSGLELVRGLVLALLVLWVAPAKAYYICAQPDGSQLITDTPGPGCVDPENSVGPRSPSREMPKKLMKKPNSTIPEATPGEQLDYQGHNREWWQSRLRSLNQEKHELEIQILDANRRLDLVPTNIFEITNRRQIREIRQEISTLNEMLHRVNQKLEKELPEEARKAGAPPGWVRE